MAEARDALGTVLSVGDFVTTAELNQYRVEGIFESEFHIIYLRTEDRHGKSYKMLPFLTIKGGRQSWYE